MYTYLIPRHCLEPLEKATFHFSSSLPDSPSQHSGMKFSGEGKTSGFRRTVGRVIATEVWEKW